MTSVFVCMPILKCEFAHTCLKLLHNCRTDSTADCSISKYSICIPDKSGIQMVQMCPVVKWYGFQMVVCFMIKKNVCNLYGLPNHE